MGLIDIKSRKTSRRSRRIIPIAINLLVWVAMVFMWWGILSLVVDMPAEYKLRHSTDDLRIEYNKQLERYDSLYNVLDNVV